MPFLLPSWQCGVGLDQNTHTHTCLTALFPGLPRWAGTRKVKPIWILLKQGTVSGSGISWAVCKSAPHSRPITTPAPHHSVFYRPDALPATQPTASKHWRHIDQNTCIRYQLILSRISCLVSTNAHFIISVSMGSEAVMCPVLFVFRLYKKTSLHTLPY